MRNVGDWFLREWMDALGLNQQDVVRLTGWSQPKVSFICSGKTQYNRSAVTAIANALGLHPAQLFMHPGLSCRISLAIDYERDGMMVSAGSKRGQSQQLFGVRLREFREERAFTQRTLQDLGGVAASYISAIENGEVNLSLDVAERLCDALGVELHKMLKPYPPVE